MCQAQIGEEVNTMLDFQNEAFLEALHEDGLLVMAKGLGQDEIILNLLKVYCDPGNLVLVIGTYSIEEEYFIERLTNDGVEHLPKVVTAEYSISDRQSLYLEGGVFFITSRILVVDLLTKRIPVETITGIHVLKAHKVLDFCQEAFILRLYRSKNKTGFIKAFSCNPDAFTRGFCQIERVMKNLFVKKLKLWPRFHATVNATLEKYKPETIEIRLSLTKPMLAIQTALLELISVSVKELKLCNSSLDLDEVTAENAISKAFDKIVQHQLENVWNQLSKKTKQLINDLKQLRSILFHLTQYDSVTFFNTIEQLKSSGNAINSSSWFFLSAAQSIFLHAKERVYGAVKSSKRLKLDANINFGNEMLFPKPADELTLEESPKWLAVNDILHEIQESLLSSDGPSEASHTLIMTADNRTCAQVQEFLHSGPQHLLKRLYNKFLVSKGFATANTTELPPRKASTLNTNDEIHSLEQQTLTQLMRQQMCSKDSNDKYDNDMDSAELLFDQLIAVRSLQNGGGSYDINRCLREFKPRFIIVYDADVTFVRQIETYKAMHCNIPVVVYFLIYDYSAEEQKYLNILRREKEAFEMLIRQKGNMVVSKEQDGLCDEHTFFDRDSTKASETVNPVERQNTRRGGYDDQKSRVQHRVIVDVREFRSELPCLIHARGIDIEPITLEVGDYILTPEICVERKSVDDLIGSLNSGRLYSQVTAMCRYYKKPMLLIEFNFEKSFSFQGKMPSSEISAQDFQSKLLLLTIHFPKLRILWCSSPYATAELFKEIKADKEQPNADEAVAITEAYTNEMGVMKEKYNSAPKDFLMLLPGVDSKNCSLIMNKISSLSELAREWSQEQLYELLSNSSSAKSLWEGVHIPFVQTGLTERGQGKGAVKFKKVTKWKK